MSRISPFYIDGIRYEGEELEKICPRYIKWTKRVMSFDFSKRKKGMIERSVPSFDLKYKLDDMGSARNSKKSKSILSQIRRGGQNLRVRCRTSAELWRRWIRGGIMYNTELDEKDEFDLDTKESEPQIVVKVDSEPNDTTTIVEIKSNETEIQKQNVENIDSEEKDTKPIDEIKPKTIDNQILDEVKTEHSVNQSSDSLTNPEQNVEIKPQENVVNSSPNINTNIENSKTSMPEVVANND